MERVSSTNQRAGHRFRGQTTLIQFVESLPKADIHVHLEGLVTKEFYVHRSANGDLGAESIFKDEYANLAAFIEAIRSSNSVLRTEEDFCSLVVDYALKSQSINVCHIELAVEPAFHVRRGTAMASLYYGVQKGLRIAAEKYGISSRLILSFTRELRPEIARAYLDEAEELLVNIDAVGIAGNENSRPFDEFVGVMQYAYRKGYSVLAHAGETTGPNEVWNALRCFPLRRIDHGCSAMHDRRLMAHLAEIDMPLAMAPISNQLTGASHNGRAVASLLRQGLCVSINSDDPGIQRSSVIDDFALLIEHQNLTAEELVRAIKNGFSSSMLDKASVTKIHEQIDLMHRQFRDK